MGQQVPTMQATRLLQQRAFSQLAKNTASKNGLLMRAAADASAPAPAASTSSSALISTSPKRTVPTTAVSADDALKMLNEQRAKRPSSPHFTIYEPQLSWLSSIANRVTGNGLSALMYAFAISYVAAPAVSAGFTGASIVALAASLPVWAKISAKIVLGAPFWYHTWNGMRHLAWDMGYLLSLKASWTAGYVVIGTTAVTTLATALLQSRGPQPSLRQLSPVEDDVGYDRRLSR